MRVHSPWKRKTTPPVPSTLVNVCPNTPPLLPVWMSCHGAGPYESYSIAVVFALSTLTSGMVRLWLRHAAPSAKLQSRTGVGVEDKENKGEFDMHGVPV